jgi:uncharacterized protein (TIGR00299 family) protein
MRTLYFDCFAGASGNMILGALIGAGVEPHKLKVELSKLSVPDFEINVSKVDRSGISSTHVEVDIPDESKHRHLDQIERIINESTVSDSVKTRAIAIFRRLAEAEANVHGTDVEKVHFHEVGALDAIIDIVGACIGFEMLEIENFACSKIHVGSGFVDMAHGKFPVPPPAVAELLRGVPVYSTEIEGELITPTGAAIISTVCSSYGRLPDLKPELASYGAGTRTYEKFPNTLRVIIGETEANNIGSVSEELTVLETNIDDSTPQVAGYVIERAFELGARDCWITPIQMKKNRPAFMISILCDLTSKQRMLELLYTETTTIGVREQAVRRGALDREERNVNTAFGAISVKISKLNGRVVNAMPEFEDVRGAAIANEVPFKTVHNAALDALSEKAIAVTSHNA